MEIRVDAARRNEHDVLRNLLQYYVYDFSEILPAEVGDTGRFAEHPLDAYWTDAWRFPFLIRVGAHLAGFALVHRRSRLSGGGDVWDMAEFFVLRRYRRSGVGMRAAHQIFREHQGPWEVRQRTANAAGTSFWRRAIGTFTGGRFIEERLDDARWVGPVQRFVSAVTA